MADKKLSSVSAVSDMNYVYAETSTGETVKISKADLASVVAGILGVTGYSLFKEYTWESGNLNDAPHGITYIHCWENTGSFTNMPISDRNANAILYSFRSEPKTNEINSAIQFFLHGHTTGVCYFRCYSNGNWSAWKVIS